MPVMHGGECVGSVRESGLMRVVIEEPARLERAVETVMDAPYPVVDGSADTDEVSGLLRTNGAVLVRTQGTIEGIVTRYDAVRALTLGRG